MNPILPVFISDRDNNKKKGYMGPHRAIIPVPLVLYRQRLRGMVNTKRCLGGGDNKRMINDIVQYNCIVNNIK